MNIYVLIHFMGRWNGLGSFLLRVSVMSVIEYPRGGVHFTTINFHSLKGHTPELHNCLFVLFERC